LQDLQLYRQQILLQIIKAETLIIKIKKQEINKITHNKIKTIIKINIANIIAITTRATTSK